MNSKKLATISGTTITILVMLLVSTNPNSVSLPLLMAPFVLLLVALVSLATLVCLWQGRTTRKYTVLSVVLGAIPVLLLLLKSIGQLGIKDIVIGLALLAVSWLYIHRLNFREDATGS